MNEMEENLLLYVAAGLFVTFIAWCIAAPVFDRGGASRWVPWTLVAAMALALAAHLASGGVL